MYHHVPSSMCLFHNTQKGRPISPTGQGQAHEDKSSQIAASHPHTHSPIRGVESNPKAGVGIRSSTKRCPTGAVHTNAPSLAMVIALGIGPQQCAIPFFLLSVNAVC